MMKNTGKSQNIKPLNHSLMYRPDGIKPFHLDMSQKGHQVVLPVEEETAWEQLREITWDPGRGD